MIKDARTDDSAADPKGPPENPDKPTLDDLLADWDKRAEKGGEKPGSDKTEAMAREVARLSYKLEMKDIIGKVKGDLPVSDDFVETYVNMRAEKDARLQELWDNRDDNRRAFDEAMSEIGKEFQDFAKQNGFKVESEDKGNDDKGLAAAARMARESQPSGSGLDNVDFGSLSDSEFGFKKQEVFRLAEAGKLK